MSRGFLLIACLFLTLKSFAVVGFLNSKNQLMLIDLQKRALVGTIKDEMLCYYFDLYQKSDAYLPFDYSIWKIFNIKIKPGAIDIQNWGENFYVAYPNMLQTVENNNSYLKWGTTKKWSSEFRLRDLIIYNDSALLSFDDFSISNSLCDENLDTTGAQFSIDKYFKIEPYFLVRKYQSGILTIASLSSIAKEIILDHHFEEEILATYTDIIAYVLTPHHLYRINPLLKKLEVLMVSENGAVFKNLLAKGGDVYVLTEDHQMIYWNTHTEKVESILTLESEPLSVGIDGYIYFNTEDRIYCIEQKTLRPSHTIKVGNERINSEVIKVLGLEELSLKN